MSYLPRLALAVLVSGALTPAVPTARAQSARQVVHPDAWADSLQRVIATARRQGDRTRMRQARSLAERVAIAHPNDARILHYLGFALYAEAGTLPGGSEEARELLQQADSILARSARLRPLAETHALRSSVIGQQIGSSPIRGMRLGPQASREMERALSLGPRNPRVWLLRGISAMHTPQAWGGGLQRAEDYLRRAIALAQVDSARFPDPTWGRGEAHVWLGEVLARRGHDTDARLEYRRALEIEPDNSRARRRLHERDDAGRP